ncbi:hypothetical protein PTKIN_Ptkin13bG0198100 [Pterospermum kingtungense]
MITHGIDPDVVRWGLQDLKVCVLGYSGSSGSVTRYDKDNSQTGYIREGNNEPECVNVENDAVIARALQEELSQVATAEASGSTNPSQDFILAQDGCGNSGMGDSPCEGLLLIDINDQSSILADEVEKRLNDMVAIPHVPKINGEIPSADEEISDHQRMLDRLQLYGLVETKVQGDGNCQFRSISDQLYRSQDHHRIVRQLVVSQLESNPEMYGGYVPMAYDDYLEKMNKNGEWGDHVTLQAAADLYGVKIFVLTSFKDTCYIEILPHYQKSQRIIFLSFWAEVHYNSIYPEGEMPMSESKKKKKWWML